MNLSIIIPTFNREEILKESLKTIIQLYPTDDLEIFVVNDSSISISLKGMPSDKRIQFLINPKNGAASARNYGVGHATKDYILFLDDDIIITEGHLEAHLDAIHLYPNDIITANRKEREDLIELFNKTSFGRYKYQHDYIWHEGFEKTPLREPFWEIAGAATFSCCISRLVFDSLGGFDEAFPYAGSEDYDLFERAKKADHKLIFDQSNWCYHNEPFNANIDTWMSRHYNGVASFILLCNKHPEIRKNERYYLYQPMKMGDSIFSLFFKMKAKISASMIGKIIINQLIDMGQERGWNDKMMTRLFNARFIQEVKRGYKHFAYLENK